MTATTTRTATALRAGAVVLYHGSQPDFHGMLFKVSYAGQMYGEGPLRYTLADYGDTDPNTRAVLTYVYRESLTRIPAAQVKTRTCRECGIHYTQVAEHGINTGGCPMCALPEVTGF